MNSEDERSESSEYSNSAEQRSADRSSGLRGGDAASNGTAEPSPSPREDIERLDNPLVMKLDTSHFPVTGDERVPRDTLAVPAELIDRTRVRNPPTLREVLLAKADRAQQLLELTGQTLPDDDERREFDAGFGGPAI